ncbi:30S ribosomal protein S9 [Candidatus Peregrinibacteria bacterium]|nr:30S ribosomal protein S9 [Candidatus Peregrinibacteria bacterium]
MPVAKKKTKKTDTEAKPTKASPSGKYFYSKGNRKNSIARVRLYKGSGEITINDKTIKEFCSVKEYIGLIKSPLKLTGTDKTYDVTVKVEGGGVHSQADAIKHGIARALTEADPTNKVILKKGGFLTRDSRTKERKKFGLKRARRGPQFSKR